MKHMNLSFVIRIIVLMVLGAVLAKELVMIFQARTDASTLASQAAVRAGTDSRTQALRSLKAAEADDAAKLDNVVVTKVKLAQVVSQIQDAGKSLGLSVNIASISGGATTASSTSATAIKISINTLGSWSANFGFVHLLENLPYKSSVDETKIALTDKGWQGSEALTLTALP